MTIPINFDNSRTRANGITKPVTKCAVCGLAGLLMWYKIKLPGTIQAYNLDPNCCWKQLVCNHFKDGQSKNRNRFCFYVKVMGIRAIKKAKPEEIKTTYHIIGSEEPCPAK